jgi:hypothetical protein
MSADPQTVGWRHTYGPYDEPTMVGLFADTSSGKSTELIRAFCGCNPVYFAGPGGLRVAQSALGIPTAGRVLVVTDFASLKATQQEVAAKFPGVFGAQITDDASVLAGREYRRLRAKYPPQGDNIFRLWQEFEDNWNDCIDNSRKMGCHSGWNFHKKVPARDKQTKEWLKGGPDMPGKKLVRISPHLFDFLARIEADPTRFPWPGYFDVRGNADPDYYTKDRDGVLDALTPVAPANLREKLRAAGIYLPRYVGKGMNGADLDLTWQDEVADAVSTRILAGDEPPAVWAETLGKLRPAVDAGKLDWRHVRWALQDGCARAEYTALMRSKLDLTPTSATPSSGGGISLA